MNKHESTWEEQTLVEEAMAVVVDEYGEVIDTIYDFAEAQGLEQRPEVMEMLGEAAVRVEVIRSTTRSAAALGNTTLNRSSRTSSPIAEHAGSR